MKSRLWILVTLFAVVMTSCNLPASQPSTPITDASPSTFSTPTLVPIETLLALATSTVAPTSTPRFTIASPIDQPVNCRSGPSTAYSVVGGLDLGRQAEIVGRDADSAWWYVRNPDNPSTYCWLFASLVNASGNLEALPVVGAPLSSVTGISVAADPPSMNVSCKAFPQYVGITAQITTNGPSNVTWRWESSIGETISKDPLLFLEGGSQTVQLYYKVSSVNDYWIQVHVLSPNDTTGRANFRVTCVP